MRYIFLVGEKSYALRVFFFFLWPTFFAFETIFPIFFSTNWKKPKMSPVRSATRKTLVYIAMRARVWDRLSFVFLLYKCESFSLYRHWQIIWPQQIHTYVSMCPFQGWPFILYPLPSSADTCTAFDVKTAGCLPLLMKRGNIIENNDIKKNSNFI